MKKNRMRLVLLQMFSTFGSAMAGIFFPFLVQRTFNLTTPETLIWGAIFLLITGLLMFPMTRFLMGKIGCRRTIQLGLFFHALFYVSLQFGNFFDYGIFISTLIFVLHLSTFWPAYHFITALSSDDGKRGNFISNIQIAIVGANLVIPILSGILLDYNLDQYIYLFSIIFFLCAIGLGFGIKMEDQKIHSFRETFSFFKKNIWHSPTRRGFLAEGFQSGILWLIWPFYLQIVLGKFALMGIVTSLAAGFEIIASKIFGKLTDKKSARNVLNIGIWTRFFDLGLRSLFMFFQNIFFVGAIQISAGILGPIFNISFTSRFYEIVEKQKKHPLEVVIIREWLLTMIRVTTLLCAAIVVHFFGEIALGWFLLAAGLSSFGFRKF